MQTQMYNIKTDVINSKTDDKMPVRPKLLLQGLDFSFSEMEN